MLKLETTEKWRVETQEEAEQFIKTAREAGSKEGYDLTKASYTHKEKTAKGEVIDACEIVLLTKVYNTVWNI